MAVLSATLTVMPRFGFKLRTAALLLFALAAGGGAWWYWLAPRTVTISLFPDYAFRQQPDWKARLESRMAQVSFLWASQTAVRWKLVSIESEDPIDGSSASMELRRSELTGNEHYPADILLIVTGVHEGTRTGVVNPFSHAGLVVDFPDRSETRNTLIMAHEMAHFFGAPHEPGSGTITDPEPDDARFSSRARTLIRSLRRYDFHRGTAALDGRWDARAVEALSQANRGLYTNPLSQAQQVIAAALVMDGRYAPSIRHLQEAMQIDPDSSVRIQLALTLVRDTQPAAAVQVLRDGIRANPGDARLRSMLASLLARRDFEAAVAEYDAAIQLEPKNPVNYAALGNLLMSGMGRIDSAVEAFEEALRLNPGMPQALAGLADARQLKTNAKAEAARRLRDVNSKPDSKLYYELGLAEMRSGDVDTAAKAFQRSIGLDPNYGTAYSALALAHYLAGDYAAALGDADRSKALGVAVPAEFLAAIQSKVK